MFTYNEYLIDIYKTNKAEHFKQILINNGFKVKERGNITTLEKVVTKEMTSINKEVLENKFKKYVDEKVEDEKDENFLSDKNI